MLGPRIDQDVPPQASAQRLSNRSFLVGQVDLRDVFSSAERLVERPSRLFGERVDDVGATVGPVDDRMIPDRDPRSGFDDGRVALPDRMPAWFTLRIDDDRRQARRIEQALGLPSGKDLVSNTDMATLASLSAACDPPAD